jgi:hypothetical protein
LSHLEFSIPKISLFNKFCTKITQKSAPCATSQTRTLKPTFTSIRNQLKSASFYQKFAYKHFHTNVYVVLILSHPFPPAITPTENINHKNHVSLFPNFLMHWKCDQIKACQMIVFLIFRKNLFGFLLMIFFMQVGK